MSKKIILLGILVVMVSIYGVFQVKYRVRELKQDLVVMHRQIASAHEEIRVLDAEWSFLNNPARIKELVDANLKLKQIQVAQIQQVDEIRQFAKQDSDENKSTKTYSPDVPVTLSSMRVN